MADNDPATSAVAFGLFTLAAALATAGFLLHGRRAGR
jgi:hypothetical protein